MQIRQVVEKDYASAMLLIVAFAEESLSDYGTYLDPEQLQKTFDAIYKTSFVALCDNEVVGVLAGRVIEDICSKRPVYEELVWYMRADKRRYGMKLFDFVVDWCKVNEITRISMSCMHNSMTDKLIELYKKLGFRPMETRFIKELE